MFVQTEFTPNPLTLKFIPGRVVMKEGTAFFQNKSDAEDSPFAKKFFNINGVNGVFLGSDFITITKIEDIEWQILKPHLLGVINEHYESGDEIISQNYENKESKNSENNKDDSDLIKQIKELIDTKVRPAVAMDGGDIIYHSFDKGIVYLHMQGACSGCPSSAVTLRSGIENMLKHYVPEVKEVKSVTEMKS